jgi:o-succinylbenzoate synthase
MLKLYTYNLPFKKPFKTAKSELTHRNGIVLVFEQNGFKAYGEIAPLPGFSKFTLQEIIPILKLNKKAIERSLIEDEFDQFSFVLYQIHDIPSLKFGLDTLYADLKAKKAGLPLSKYLFKHSFEEKVRVNATLGITDLESSIVQAKNYIEEGFNTLKVKVGINTDTEFKLLKVLRSQFQDIKIRIDANQSWSFNEAIKILNNLESLGIEFCEEPLKVAEAKYLPELKKLVKIKLAADESFRNKKDAIRLIKQDAVETLILKPMMFGSFSEINVTKQLADSHYNSVVFTTSLESKIGRTITAILTSGWGATNYAHGLSTGSLFEYDLGEESEIHSGFFHLPIKPGIGIDLNVKHLKEII